MTKMLWNPETGEPILVQDGEAAPDGFLDHHPADPAYGDAADADAPASQNKTPKPKPMTKAELTAALSSGNIQFDADAKVAELDALLNAKLTEALTARGAEIAAGTTTRELWEAVRK